MKTLLAFSATFALCFVARAADKPLLAIPGKVIYESKLDTAPSAPWKAAKGKWELAGGVLRGSEKPEDNHGGVTRLPNKLGDFVIEYEFKFEGAKSTSLSINAVKDHMARILITPKAVEVRRDDNDHDGPDKAIVFARFPVDFKNGEWHKVRMEMVGDTMLGQVDDLIAWGSSDLFKQDRMTPGFTVGGQSVDFRNFKISEAKLNPEWDSVKSTLPKPGEKMAPAIAAKGGAGKAKAKK
ncbi:MAG TPA: family 16 glycoside hydrolase [Verrucomicrobiaceae bacterium]